MGTKAVPAGTVAVVMTEPDEHPGGPARGPVRRRRLDRRVVGIAVCLAFIGAVAAYLTTAAIIGDGDEVGSTRDGGAFELVDSEVDGSELLQVPLLTVAGKPTMLGASLGDQPMLVNLWQQSCAPCVTEMPIFEELHQSDARVDVVGVNTQDRVPLAKEMAAQTGITYPWVRDDEATFFYEAKATALPYTLLVDRSGKVLATRNGPFDDLDELRGWLDRHLS